MKNRMTKTKLIVEVLKCAPAGWIMNALYDVLLGGSSLLLSYLIKLLLDSMTGSRRAGFTDGLIVLCVAVSIMSVVDKNIYRYPPIVFDKIYQKIKLTMLSKYVKKLQKIPMQNFDKSEFLQKLSIAEKGIVSKNVEFLANISAQGSSFLVLIFAAINLIRYSWVAAVTAVASSVLVYYISRYADKKSFDLEKANKESDMISYYYSGLFMDRENMAEIKAFDSGGTFSVLSVDSYRKVRKASRKLSLEKLFLYGGADFLGASCNLFIYWFVISFMADGRSTVGDLFFIISLFRELLDQCVWQVKGISNMKLSSKYIDEAVDIFNMEETNSHEGCSGTEEAAPAVEFRNVSFRYDDAQSFSIDDIIISINPGECIAVLGENGSGKSTLIKLMCGLLVPDRGEISVGGLSPEKYMHHIGAVFQDYTKFAFDFRTNIALGSIDDQKNHGGMYEAVKKAGADKVLSCIQGGWDAFLGTEFEKNGVDVSEGQWQRIKLGKMLFKKSRFYVLDEPSAGLDSLAEYDLFKNIKKITNGATTVLVSHRLGFARLADRIVCVKDGRIAETGTHEELLYRGGEYSKLYHQQIKYYDMESYRKETSKTV